ncbi:MAG: penicillin acylase family protein [bacterium]
MLARVLGGLVAAPAPRTFPELDAAALPDALGRIEIVRDANGVSHVYADDERDLYRAAGWLQAADRFFFIDIIRHLGAGRMCEFLGDFRLPAAVEGLGGMRVADLDGFLRPLDFEAQSRADFVRLAPRPAALLEAFAAGVNAALVAMRGTYPPEYLAAGGVRPWQAADCLLNGRACALVVSLTGFENERLFDGVRGALGDVLTRRLYPDAPWAKVPGSYAVGGGDDDAPEAPLGTIAAGSNNWAVSGALSASGKPIVANDPHVPFMPLPTFWHHLHLEGPRHHVQGGMFPGFPGFGFGHNGAVAWGCTTGFRDAFDVYRVHRLADDPTRYRTPHGSGVITKHRQTLPARWRRRVTLRWEACEHGILLPDWRHHDGVELAVRVVPSDLAGMFEGYLGLAEAQTVDAFRAALARCHDGPFDFNLVYGHRDGAIGWEMFGRTPHRQDGLFVRDADDPVAQWDGWVPFEAMPKQRDPARGYVATANSRTDPQCDVAFDVTHCEPRYRTARIERVLESRRDHSVDSFAALQRDLTADYAPAQRDALLAAIGAVAGNDVASRALSVLAAWDGTFPSDSAGAALYALIQRDLPRRLFAPLLGAKLGPRYANGRRAMPRMHALLLDAADPLRADLERAAGTSIDALVRQSFFAVVQRLAARQGPDPAGWRWGAVQRVRLGTPLSLLPGIGRHFVALDAAFPGDEYTVNPSRSIAVRGTLYALVGATSRFICDLATPEEALFAHSAGPSADARSTFFRSGAQSWQRFEYFRSALWKADDIPNVVERSVVEP